MKIVSDSNASTSSETAYDLFTSSAMILLPVL